MTSPIENDLNSIDTLIGVGSKQSDYLLDQAGQRFSLVSAITSHPDFTTAAGVFAAVIDDNCRYRFETYSQNFIRNNGSYFGNSRDYRGNLKNWTITWNTTTITYDGFVSNYQPTGLIPMITAPSAPVTYFELSTFTFMANQFAFLNQYLWADPTNPSLSAYATSPNMKYGVYYSAKSTTGAASAIQIDTAFYLNKKEFLTPLA